jgi:hypothetical protein
MEFRVGIIALGGIASSLLFLSEEMGLPKLDIDRSLYGTDEKCFADVKWHQDISEYLDIFSRVTCVASVVMLLIGCMFQEVVGDGVVAFVVCAIPLLGGFALCASMQLRMQAILKQKLYLMSQK